MLVCVGVCLGGLTVLPLVILNSYSLSRILFMLQSFLSNSLVPSLRAVTSLLYLRFILFRVLLSDRL